MVMSDVEMLNRVVSIAKCKSAKCEHVGHEKVCTIALSHLRQDGLDDSAHLHESDAR